MRQYILTLKIYYTIIFRVKPIETTPLDAWLRARGWKYNQDFYAALLLIPFALMVITGVASERFSHDATFGINLVVVLLGYLGMNLFIDIFNKYHLMPSTFSKLIRILPLSTFKKLLLLFSVEFFGYKFYACCMTVIMIAIFNHVYAENLLMPIHPKIVVICLAVLILSCSTALFSNAINSLHKLLPKKILFFGSRTLIFLVVVIAYKLKLFTSVDLLYRKLCAVLEYHFMAFVVILLSTSLLFIFLARLAFEKR